jgi:hypothetical protein
MEKIRNEVDRWLTRNEEDRLMAASSVWLREIIVFALHTGMRQGEILNELLAADWCSGGRYYVAEPESCSHAPFGRDPLQ